MASGLFAARRSTSSRPAPHLGYIPIALGAAAIVAGLGGRKKAAAALALTALAGAGAMGKVRSARSEHGKAGGELEVARSITIG